MTNSTGSYSQVRFDLFVLCIFLHLNNFLPEEKILPGIVLIFFIGYITMAASFYISEV